MSKAISLTSGNVKAAMKAAGAPSSDLWKVPPSQLRVIEGFNPRIKNDAYKARVRFLADSMHEAGFLTEYPLVGYVAKEEGADVIYVTGGHRRHEAVMLAISEGKAIEYVPVVVPRAQNMADLIVACHLGNDVEPLSPFEQATLCKRLVGEGLDSSAIAKRMRYASAQYVDGLLSLVAAPLPVRKMVMEGVVSATTAISTLAKHGDKAQEVLLGAVVKAGTTGRGRVTAKDLPGAAFKKSLRKAAEPMHAAIQMLTCDPAFNKLSQEVKVAIGEAMALITQGK